MVDEIFVAGGSYRGRRRRGEKRCTSVYAGWSGHDKDLSALVERILKQVSTSSQPLAEVVVADTPQERGIQGRLAEVLARIPTFGDIYGLKISAESDGHRIQVTFRRRRLYPLRLVVDGPETWAGDASTAIRAQLRPRARGLWLRALPMGLVLVACGAVVVVFGILPNVPRWLPTIGPSLASGGLTALTFVIGSAFWLLLRLFFPGFVLCRQGEAHGVWTGGRRVLVDALCTLIVSLVVAAVFRGR